MKNGKLNDNNELNCLFFDNSGASKANNHDNAVMQSNPLGPLHHYPHLLLGYRLYGLRLRAASTIMLCIVKLPLNV